LRIGVVADTHSHPHERTHALLRELAPDAIVHAGDIGDGSVLDGLRAIAPLHAIRGNIDEVGLPDLLTIEVGELMRVLVQHIAVAGPRLRADAIRNARAARAHLVVCGHSHVPFIGKDQGFAVFNPGSCGPRRFQLPIVIGLIEIANGKVAMSHHDCETGKPWSPP
jgi:putative phosphoesterase